VSKDPLNIHLVAIGGTGMAPLACLLQGLGHKVRGSDGPIYPPMSSLLEQAGIEPLVGYDPSHLQPLPDLVVVGNAVPRDNPEAVEAERLQLDRLSMPEALAHFFLQYRRPLVVAGTHGKTTTTSLASWVYTDCGTDPGFLVGGVPLNLGRSFQQGTGPRFVIEGDEYNAAYFDRGPKFLHYRPDSLILTSVEYDHADLYPDPETLTKAYEDLVSLVPETGLIAACGDIPEVREIVEKARCRTVLYGFSESNDLFPLGPVETDAAGSRFRIRDPREGEIEIRTSMVGPHNICNTLGVWACARHDGLPAEDVVAALDRFEGVKRRLEILGTHRDITVIDDFAHHPTAVDMTLQGLRSRFPDRRLVAIFEPRTLTAGRSFLHEGYLQGLSRADRVLLAPIFHHLRLPAAERLDLDRLAADLEAGGTPTTLGEDVDSLLVTALAEARPGDVFITMSSGSFEGLPYRILAGLDC
jgi:UDP-N-acetylmuramate: L-alanyl-gamma-D-glutamyl-meso-diaminopimelate ligase